MLLRLLRLLRLLLPLLLLPLLLLLLLHHPPCDLTAANSNMSHVANPKHTPATRVNTCTQRCRPHSC
jgi:hypothetical protein